MHLLYYVYCKGFVSLCVGHLWQQRYSKQRLPVLLPYMEDLLDPDHLRVQGSSTSLWCVLDMGNTQCDCTGTERFTLYWCLYLQRRRHLHIWRPIGPFSTYRAEVIDLCTGIVPHILLYYDMSVYTVYTKGEWIKHKLVKATSHNKLVSLNTYFIKRRKHLLQQTTFIDIAWLPRATSITSVCVVISIHLEWQKNVWLDLSSRYANITQTLTPMLMSLFASL